jgi:hypothetical protein
MQGTQARQTHSMQHSTPATLHNTVSEVLNSRSEDNYQQTHICIGVPSVVSLVTVRRWQKGQSIHCGCSPS